MKITKITKIVSFLYIFLFAVFLIFSVKAIASEIQYDLVILNGQVIDPETQLDAIRNIGIIGDKIAAVTKQNITGKSSIDAKGLVVAPGFIDMHAHGQTKTADRMQAFDGVTTTLELESGILPISDWYRTQAEVGRLLNYGAAAAWTFARISELEGIQAEADLLWFQKAFALNKWTNDPATQEQIGRIVAHIEQGIKEGSLGIGINAGYAPGGGFKELLAVHALAAKYNVPTFTHIGGDFPDDPGSAAECVGQIIAFSASTGSQNHICHLNSSSLRDIQTTRDMILNAQKNGLAITTESYTYGASSTTIGSALFNAEGIKRKHISYKDITLNGTALDERSFTKIRKEAPGSVIVFNFLNMPKDEPLLDESVLFPGGAIASDAMPWVDTDTGLPVDDNVWPLGKTAFAHPRSAGTYGRLLAHWVRERKVLSLSEAVRKSSLIPAQILQNAVPQMRKKGRIQAGMDADIIVFDADAVREQATFTQPYLPTVGMRYVLVNGQVLIDDGELDPQLASGKAIRRKPIE